MDKQHRIWSLLARRLAGEASAAELEELEAMVRDNPELGYYIKVFISCWPGKDKEVIALAGPVLERIIKRIGKQQDEAAELPGKEGNSSNG